MTLKKLKEILNSTNEFDDCKIIVSASNLLAPMTKIIKYQTEYGDFVLLGSKNSSKIIKMYNPIIIKI